MPNYQLLLGFGVGVIVMDKSTKEQLHRRMSNIRSKDTSIEISLRKALWHRGFRYRKNYKVLPGSPDIAITKYKIAVFCDSEFFHGKNWFTILRPRIQRGNNSEYWEKKILRNMERDEKVDQALAYLGWTVIHFWGDEIKKDLDACVNVVEETVLEQIIEGAELDGTDVFSAL